MSHLAEDTKASYVIVIPEGDDFESSPNQPESFAAHAIELSPQWIPFGIFRQLF